MAKRYYGDSEQLSEREIVLLKDERRPVLNTTRPPFRWICSLEVEFAEPVYYPLATLEQPGKDWATLVPARKGCGSGLLISPAHVLTAAHVLAGLKVVQDRSTGQHRFKVITARKVTVIPGRYEAQQKDERPYGSWSAGKIRVNPDFRKAMEVPVAQLTKEVIRRALAADVGLVQIRERPSQGQAKAVLPGQLAGWWGESDRYVIGPVQADLRKRLERQKVHIGGYPGEKGRLPCGSLWKSHDRVIAAFPQLDGRPLDLLLYAADTSAGMSGSPVWIVQKDGRHILVAVHSSFVDYQRGPLQRANAGALLTGKMISLLQQWNTGYLEVIFSNRSA
jgi:V8-like Glu-specific endopeptidase